MRGNEMTARKQIARTSTNSTSVNGKRFFNEAFSKGDRATSSTASMRQAAKRFANSPDFDENVLYYEGFILNGRWAFEAVGGRTT